MSNFYCLPGKAGGSPMILETSARAGGYAQLLATDSARGHQTWVPKNRYGSLRSNVRQARTPSISRS